MDNHSITWISKTYVEVSSFSSKRLILGEGNEKMEVGHKDF